MKKRKSSGKLITTFIVIIIIFLIIIFWPFKGEEKNTTTATQEDSLRQAPEPKTEPEPVLKEEVVAQALKEKVQEKTAVEGLCEDYTLNEGEVMKLDGNTIKVDKVGSKSVKISVNGKEEMANEEDYNRIDGFGVKVNNIFYFGKDDKNNGVELRLGCDNSKEDPKDKYVYEKGAAACSAIIKQMEQECIAKFDLDKNYFD